MKIKLFYLHYNISGSDYKSRPEGFSFESCFDNLLSTLDDRVELHLIFDGSVESNWISKFSDRYILHEVEGGDITKPAMAMYDIANSINIDEPTLFYFLENDYLHQPNWIDKVQQLYNTYGQGLSYVSLYDHNDKYMSMYSDLVSKIYCDGLHHWRTTPSTCGSFIVSSDIFKEDYEDFTTVIGDHNKWLHLNKTKGRFILSPIPGLSTHCMQGLESPTLNWRTK